MTDQPTTSDSTNSDPTGTGPDRDELPEVDDSALIRAQDSIDAAKDAEGSVAASDDITVLDDERAGEFSEDPDGTGGS